uniref:Uncharacterized protein n=1 Tax=Anguilla anguilla TaxID=7936 RepID=A0A0E9TIG6_ANGAN
MLAMMCYSVNTLQNTFYDLAQSVFEDLQMFHIRTIAVLLRPLRSAV